MQLHPTSKLQSLGFESSKGLVKSKNRSCQLLTPGLVAYRAAWEWQRSQVADRKLDPTLEDALLLLEHPAVYTLGLGSDFKFLKFDPADSPHDLVQIERGGEVTYHCPGQLVGYPILNLTFYQKDLHWYLRQLEEVVIQVLADYGLIGSRIPGLTGVWVEDCKVAAIGIKVSRWITMHGFALNVCPDLSGFDAIVPCGIADKSVGSLAQFIPTIQIEDVIARVAIAFSSVFQVQLVAGQVLFEPMRIAEISSDSVQSHCHRDLG